MQIAFRVARFAAALAFAACSLVTSAPAQTCQQNGICITRPTENETTHMPVWLRADATTCNGHPVTSFGYSYDASVFVDWGFPDAYGWHIDNIDLRLVSQSPQAKHHTVHYKAWTNYSDLCPADIDVYVSGNNTTVVSDVQGTQYPNDPNGDSNGYSVFPGDMEVCPHLSEIPNAKINGDWYWDWDPGTGQCTYPEVGVNSPDHSTSYNVTTPSQDQDSRLFYNVWLFTSSQKTNPGERYSLMYNPNNLDTTSNYFVYDTYVYIPDPYPNHLHAVQMDTNWINPQGNLMIFGLQCVHGDGTWEFTTVNASNNQTEWRNPVGTGWTQDTCDPWTWTSTSTPNGWHHVQLATHRDDSGNVYYDYIVFDAHYKKLSVGWYGYSTITETPPWPAGQLFLNFQFDGEDCPSLQKCPPYPEMTAAVYTDGMEMIRGVNLW